MDDTNLEKAPNNFTVEITDLDGSVNKSRTRRAHLTSRQRRLSVIATAILFVLVMGLLAGSVGEVRGWFGQALHLLRSTPTSSVLSGSLPVYFQGNPSWGHFTLDGKALARPPVVGRDQPLMLSPGMHTLVWNAEPFRAKTCALTVDGALTVSGSCFLNSEITNRFGAVLPATIIAFFASLDDLPGDQRAPLVRQMQQTFAHYESSEQVQPGELYAVSEQAVQKNPALCRPFEIIALCYARATQPLTATMSLQMDTLTTNDDPCVTSGQCDINRQDCRKLCEDPALDYSQQGISGWSVYAIASLQWSYYTLTGQRVASAQPNSAIRGTQTYQDVSVHIERDSQGRWRIEPFPAYGFASANPLCTQAISDTMSILNVSFDNNSAMYVDQQAFNPTRIALGCLTIAIQPMAGLGITPTPTPAADALAPASFLQRFGVLLAVNASARKICPDLPVANAYEQQIAQGLLAEHLS